MLRRYNNNFLKLSKFILWRERFMTPIWLLCIIGMTLIVPPTFKEMYASDADRVGMALTMKNPAMIAMCGPIYGESNYTIGAMVANEMILFTLLAVALMNIFFVIRHTRRDEERGRIELIRSLPTGRLSNLSATLLVAFVINTVLALLTGISLAILGIDSMGFEGSMLYGAVFGVTGMLFAALAALFAQVYVSSKSALAYSIVAIGVLYMIRAIGDINNEALSLISPLGLILRTQVYVKNVWWPVPIVLIETVCIIAVTYYLSAIRDLGQGFIADKPGRKNASPFLRSPMGLAFRLLRMTLIGWGIGNLILGASYGSIMGDLETFLEKNEMLKQILPADSGFSVTQLFITMIMSVLAIISTIPCMTVILKLRGEEKRNHIEHLASRAVSRVEIIKSYFIISFISSFVMLFASVLGLWAASYSVMETPIPFWDMFKSMMVYIPAVWVMLGVCVLLIGIKPEWTGISWIYLGASFFTVYLGNILQLPEWTKKLTPFGHIPQLPLDDINYVSLGLLTLVAAGLAGAGFYLYRQRDLKG